MPLLSRLPLRTGLCVGDPCREHSGVDWADRIPLARRENKWIDWRDISPSKSWRLRWWWVYQLSEWGTFLQFHSSGWSLRHSVQLGAKKVILPILLRWSIARDRPRHSNLNWVRVIDWPRCSMALPAPSPGSVSNLVRGLCKIWNHRRLGFPSDHRCQRHYVCNCRLIQRIKWRCRAANSDLNHLSDDLQRLWCLQPELWQISLKISQSNHRYGIWYIFILFATVYELEFAQQLHHLDFATTRLAVAVCRLPNVHTALAKIQMVWKLKLRKNTKWRHWTDQFAHSGAWLLPAKNLNVPVKDDVKDVGSKFAIRASLRHNRNAVHRCFYPVDLQLANDRSRDQNIWDRSFETSRHEQCKRGVDDSDTEYCICVAKYLDGLHFVYSIPLLHFPQDFYTSYRS